MVMPFQEKLKQVYEDHIRKVVQKLNISIARGDDFFTSSSIISDIWNAINSCEIVIADCTGRNPNVFYEIGIAHTLGKPVIFISQSKEDIPFDIQHIRYIIYEFTPRGMREFEEKLAQTIQQEISKIRIDNYVKKDPRKNAQHSVHPTGGSLRVFKQFSWLGAGSGKTVFPRPTHQRVTLTVGLPNRMPSRINFVQDIVESLIWRA